MTLRTPDDVPDFWRDAPDDGPAGRYIGPERRSTPRCYWCDDRYGHHRDCPLRDPRLRPEDVRREDHDDEPTGEP